MRGNGAPHAKVQTLSVAVSSSTLPPLLVKNHWFKHASRGSRSNLILFAGKMTLYVGNSASCTVDWPRFFKKALFSTAITGRHHQGHHGVTNGARHTPRCLLVETRFTWEPQQSDSFAGSVIPCNQPVDWPRERGHCSPQHSREDIRGTMSQRTAYRVRHALRCLL